MRQFVFTVVGALIGVSVSFFCRGVHAFDPLLVSYVTGGFFGAGLHGVVFGDLAPAGRGGRITKHWRGMAARLAGLVTIAVTAVLAGLLLGRGAA